MAVMKKVTMKRDRGGNNATRWRRRPTDCPHHAGLIVMKRFKNCWTLLAWLQSLGGVMYVAHCQGDECMNAWTVMFGWRTYIQCAIAAGRRFQISTNGAKIAFHLSRSPSERQDREHQAWCSMWQRTHAATNDRRSGMPSKLLNLSFCSSVREGIYKWNE
jgi:hypothetical protein